MGVLAKICEKKKTLRGTKILFSGRGLKFFSPLRGTGTNSKTTHHLLSFFLGSMPLKVPQKLPHLPEGKLFIESGS